MSTTNFQPPKNNFQYDEGSSIQPTQLHPENPLILPRGIYDSTGKPLTLGVKIGTGGQGSVFDVIEAPQFVAKIYHTPPVAEKTEKLLALAKLANDQLAKISAWPVDVLREFPGGQVIGFLMHKIAQAEEVHALHSPKSRLRKFPDASWAFLIHAATNIARAVAALHEHGFVIGDINPKNILITRKATVYLLDCDSFQLTTDGITYRCDAGFPDYTPPELQGIAFKEIDRNQEHDSFGLAIVIFQLLFLGRHPYSGRFLGQGEMPLENAIQELRFAYGADAKSRQMQPPPGTLSFQAIPQNLAELFQRAFLSNDRPNPHEWIAPLESLAQALKRCEAHSGHWYFQELEGCPWCELEAQIKIRLFNFQFGDKRKGTNAVQLDLLWRDIQALKNTVESPEFNDTPMLAINASPEAVAFSSARENALAMGFGIAIVGGLLTGAYLSLPYSFLAIFALALLALIVAKVDFSDGTNPQFSFWQFRLKNDYEFVQKIAETKREAEAKLNVLRQRYGNLFNQSHWQEQIRELENQFEAYANFAQTRQINLQQLPQNLRAAEVQKYLRGISVDDEKFARFDLELIGWLKKSGIQTAADITKANLKNFTFISDARKQALLDWRSQLVSKYISTQSKEISKSDWQAAVLEIESRHLRLEQQIAQKLHHLKQHGAQTPQEFQKAKTAINQAQTDKAQAERNYDLVVRRNKPLSLLVALLCSYFFASFLTLTFAPPEPEKIGVATQTSTVKSKTTDDVDKALKAYEAGVIASRQGEYLKAISFFDEAINYDPGLVGAFHELGYVYYKIGNYSKTLDLANAIESTSGGSFDSLGNKGLVYAAQQKWVLARDLLTSAISKRNPEYWYPRFPEVCYAWSLSQAKLGETDEIIRSLEQRLINREVDNEAQFQLATLYLATGNIGKAKALLPTVKADHKDLGIGLESLLRAHEKPQKSKKRK